jgi:amidase/aspartyl-tRNA(Asn)/glutamyl-tRNA(Gln) amidotransferase subunit A
MSPTNPIDLCFLPATELAARIRRRDVSPVEVVEAYLHRIEERNPAVNAYTLVLGEQAVEAARAAEAAVTAGQPLGPLHGVPVAIKDLDDVAWRADVHGVASGPESRPENQRSGRRKIT